MIRKKRGFTLIEIVIAITLAGLLGLAFSHLIGAGMNAWFLLKTQNALVTEANSSMQRMVREIKRTKDNGASIITYDPTQYKFVDIDDNPIDYQKEGTNLNRNDKVLLNNLASADGLAFVYLDRNGAVTGTKSQIQTVQITLKLEDDYGLLKLRSAANIRYRE